MNNEWLARLKEKIGKKENKEELPVRKKLLLLFLNRTAVAGDRAAISEKIRFGRCGDRNRDNHRKPWII